MRWLSGSKEPAAKPDVQPPHLLWWKERINSCRLSSDLHTHAMAHPGLCVRTPTNE